jgi:hypothetical protein
MQLTEDHLPFQTLRRTWQPVANAASLAPGAIAGCTLLDTELVLARFPDGDERVLLHVPSPHMRESCTVFWSLAISPGFRGPPAAAQLDFAIRVLDEDRRMCENSVRLASDENNQL